MSKSATPKLKQLARRLLAYELESGKPADAKDSAAFHVCEKLRVSLGKLMGQGGFCSLLSRALMLAGAEVVWLHSLELKGDGTLEGLDELEAKFGSRAVAEGEVVLVAELLGLLVTFVGPDLTLWLLHDGWPELGDLNLEKDK